MGYMSHKEMFTVTFSPSFCLLKAQSSVDSVITVIVQTVFVLTLLFDIEKVGQKSLPKNKYFFASSRGLSLDDKTTDYVDRNTRGQVCSLHEVTQLG